MLLGVILLSVVQTQAQKTDTIYHINENILTGEFKKMNYGVVTWKMDGMGTISLEEPKINTIKSDKQFEITMDNGQIYFASFAPSEHPRKVILVMNGGNKEVAIMDIVEVYPIRNNIWRRMSANVSLGLNYAKGSNVATLAFAGNVDYRKRRSYYSLNWDTNDTYQGDTLSSSKSDVSLNWQRKLNKSWSTNLAVVASQNLELGTDLRLNLNLTGVKDIVYNEWNRLYLGMGLNASRETPTGDEPNTDDLAGLLQLKWRVYKLTAPKIWVDAGIDYIPYLTDAGRSRVAIIMNPKVNLFNDNFKIGLNFYYNYDSKPRTQDAANDDYGLNLQFTYSLN